MDKNTAITIFEKCDEEQIMRADQAVKQAMVYETTINGERVKEITYTGIKHLILEFSTKDNPLEILESQCVLEKDDPNDKETWHWRAYKKFRNLNSKLESDGRAECGYLERKKEYQNKKWTGKFIIGEYDSFAQRKADSKAERNAQRKQIPELVIKEFLKSVNGDQVKNIEEPQSSQSDYCTCSLEERKVTPDKGGCSNCQKSLSPLVSEALRKK